jgi:hypothetical protein
MSFQDFLYRHAHRYPGKVPAIAARMKKNPTVLQHKLNPNNTTHGINADEIEEMLDFTDGNMAAAEHFAAKVGAVVVRLTGTPMSDMELLDEFLSAVRELGEFSSVFQNSFADGRITPEEFKKIKKEAQDVQRQLATCVQRIESLVEKPKSSIRRVK